MAARKKPASTRNQPAKKPASSEPAAAKAAAPGASRAPADLTQAIADAARRALTDLRLEHPGERFYFFALCTSPDFARLEAVASSEESLALVASQHAAKGPGRGLAARMRELRYSAADAFYRGLGGAEIEGLGGRAGLEQACFDALHRLDETGLFGDEEERNQFIANVVFGDTSDERWLANARRLNPEAAIERALPCLRLPGS